MITTLGDEKAILGYMIYRHLDSQLTTEQSFFYEKHRDLYRVIMKLRKAGKVVDCVSIEEEIRDRENEFAFTITNILDLDRGLLQDKYAEVHFNSHVRSLLIKNRKQKILETFQEATKHEKTEDPWPAFKRLYKAWNSLELEVGTVETFSMAANAKDLKEFIEKKRLGEFWGYRIKSFPRLTAALMGLREIVVLAAKPKIGKTTFVLQIESEISDLGAGVIHYDFENGLYNLMMREACRRFDIDYRTELLNDDWPGFNPLIEKIRKIKNLAIITDRALTIDKIRGHIFSMRETTGNDNVLIAIDSLQKLPMENLRERRAAVDLWLRNFEELKAEDPYLTILLVSELSREGQKPKESGDIEYTGHFLLRLENNQTEKEIRKLGFDDNIRKLWIEYARDVATGNPIKYQADFSHWKFSELEENR